MNLHKSFVFGTGLILAERDQLTSISDDALCDNVRALLPGTLLSHHIHSCLEINKVTTSGKNLLYFLSVDNDEQMVGKLRDKDTFVDVNFGLVLMRGGEWHLLYGAQGLWHAIYGVAFEAFAMKHIQMSRQL